LAGQTVYKFFSKAITYPLLFAIGVSLTPWETLVAALTPANIAVIVLTVATLKQRHEMAADETGSAEHRYSAGHGSSPSSRRCWRSHQSIPATTRAASGQAPGTAKAPHFAALSVAKLSRVAATIPRPRSSPPMITVSMLRRHHAGARGHDQDLVAGVRMPTRG
jgi:hypothetical protein